MNRHPLVSHFSLAYAISWVVWAPIVAAARGWVDWQVPYALYYLGSSGPFLAALIVTGVQKGPAGMRRLLSGLVRCLTAEPSSDNLASARTAGKRGYCQSSLQRSSS